MKAKALILLFAVSSFINCKSQVRETDGREIREARNILNTYFDAAFENRGILFNNKILHNYRNKHWSHLINSFNLGLIQNFDIKTESDVVHFEDLFNDEIEFLQESSKDFKINNWNEILNKKSIVESGDAGLSLSSPAFDKTFTYAIFYLESNEGGSLIIFKKEDEGWIYFASGMVWVA